MTNEQLAMVLIGYFNSLLRVKRQINDEDYASATITIAEISARLDAQVKTLGVDAYVSPLD